MDFKFTVLLPLYSPASRTVCADWKPKYRAEGRGLNLKLLPEGNYAFTSDEGRTYKQVLTEHFPTRLYFLPFSATA